MCLLPETEGGREEPSSSSLAPRTPTITLQHLGGCSPQERNEEEEEDKRESSSSRGQAKEGLVETENMNVDSPLPSSEFRLVPFHFRLPAPSPPPPPFPTPHLSAEDPIGDTLYTIFQAMAGPRLTGRGGPDHTPLTSEGWYEYIPGDAHVWMDIPPLHPDPNDESKLSPAKYL